MKTNWKEPKISVLTLKSLNKKATNVKALKFAEKMGFRKTDIKKEDIVLLEKRLK